MSVSLVKNWIAEVLTFGDLNAEFANIYTNGEDLAWPATKAKDLDGQELTLSSDGTDSITADTNGQIDFAIANVDVLILTGSSLKFLGSDVVTLEQIRRLGLSGVTAKVADVEHRTYNLEQNHILESQVFS